MDGLLPDEDNLTRSDSVVKKRLRHELDESVFDSPDVKRLRDDLFDDSGHDAATQDLDSLMKSFEDELSNTAAQDSGEAQPDLGYLFEASDDELGLPPPLPAPQTTALPPSSEEAEETVKELVRAPSDSSEVGELGGFEEAVTGVGSFELDDGLFEYSDVCLDSGDVFSWQPETLPAE
ncbi:unnamed protein product [Eruca vesicaria subsp. sativa]|uniref:Uncharacterized protein n=1 Tax=Eruca vesicaria subsp. sativa TaxID=29727 RepID=A0ABC8KPY8_ERUVS|nr:unnamed protein product [Eruca vesicaria subsp. sativa]